MFIRKLVNTNKTTNDVSPRYFKKYNGKTFTKVYKNTILHCMSVYVILHKYLVLKSSKSSSVLKGNTGLKTVKSEEVGTGSVWWQNGR